MSIEHPEQHKYPTSILLRKFSGKIGEEEIINSWKYLHESNRFSSDTKGVLNDLEDCELTMSIEGFHKLMNYMKEQEHLKGLRIAVVTNSPREIIFPALGEMKIKELMIKPFSTFISAVDWILGN